MNTRYFNAGFAGGPLDGAWPSVHEFSTLSPQRPTQPNIDQYEEHVEAIYPSISMANVQITIMSPTRQSYRFRNRTGTPSYFSFVGQFKREA